MTRYRPNPKPALQSAGFFGCVDNTPTTRQRDTKAVTWETVGQHKFRIECTPVEHGVAVDVFEDQGRRIAPTLMYTGVPRGMHSLWLCQNVRRCVSQALNTGETND